MSVQSTASAASIGSTTAQNTNSVPQPTPISTPTGIVTSTATPSPVKTNVGAIAGGVVGGVMILATITAVAALFFCRRRKRSNSPEKVDLDAPIPNATVTPFTYDNSNTDPHSHAGTIFHGGTTSYVPTSYGGPSSYAPSVAYTGQHDAPPIYSPSTTSPPPTSPGSSGVSRGFSQRKGAYAPVSTVPH
ncbi:hypothetical protein FRC12_010052 [Ceratobasidium sp. 428]|nr:hypothetical protein FRC12_010052 [Ceratobasidium sp. 428]